MSTAGAGILGFILQCSVCPQRAIVATQPSGDWVCPRCAEVAPAVTVRTWFPGDPAPSEPPEHTVVVESGHDIGLSAAAEAAAAMFPQHRGRAGGFGDIDIAMAEPDHYPIEKVRG